MGKKSKKLKVSKRELEVLLYALNELKYTVSRVNYTSPYKVSYLWEIKALEKSLSKRLRGK